MNSIVFFTGVVDTGEKFIDFCTCVRRTYVRRKDARTSVFRKHLCTTNERLYGVRVYIRRTTTSKYGVQCCLWREINNKHNKIRKGGRPISAAQIYLLITESSGVRTCT
jgi:hypothetical protein